MEETLGVRFAHALGGKDFDAIATLLHPQVDLKGLTPGRPWEAIGPVAVNEVLREWFAPDDHIEELLEVTTGMVGGRGHVAYRFAVSNEDGDFEVEQQMYYDDEEGRISLMRVLCSGFRPRERDGTRQA